MTYENFHHACKVGVNMHMYSYSYYKNQLSIAIAHRDFRGACACMYAWKHGANRFNTCVTEVIELATTGNLALLAISRAYQMRSHAYCLLAAFWYKWLMKTLPWMFVISTRSLESHSYNSRIYIS